MHKKIKFFLIRIFFCITTNLLNIFIRRDRNTFIFSVKTEYINDNKNTKDYFMHNTKYLFLYLQNCAKNKIKAIYICDDSRMQQGFKNVGIKQVYSRKSLWGLYYILRAKYWFYDTHPWAISKYSYNNAKLINLWHGIPLKKIGYDAEQLKIVRYSGLQKMIFEKLMPTDNNYIVNSEYEQACYETAFQTDKECIKIFGSPRLDILLHDIPNSSLFMEEDFAAIKGFKEAGKKLFFYTPTFRDTGKDISGWLKSDNLKRFLKENNAILVCKLHFADKNSLDFELTEEFYKMDSDSDIYPVLKYSDALITDYSSIYFDYLLLDKPILYYPIDLEEYQEKCRGFYAPYEELTAGIKAYNEDELINAMQEVINGVDNYKEQRKALRDRMFKYQDGHNCERVVEWIKSLN